MKYKKKLLSNFFSLLSLQGLSFLLPLITAPYLFRVLGAEKFGFVSFSLVIMAFLRIIVDYGFQLTAVREIALCKDNQDKLNQVFSKTIIAKMFLLIFTFSLLTILIYILDVFDNNWLLFYFSFLFVVGHALFPMWFFQGMEEMKYISYLNIASKALFAISIVILIKSPDDYLLYPLLNGISVIIVGIYALYIIIKKYDIKFIWQPLNNIVELFKKGWNVFLGEVSPTFYTNFTTFLLGYYVSMESVGYLTLANRLVSATTSIIYIARNVTFPHLNKNFTHFKKITTLMIALGFLFTLFLFTSSEYIVPFLFEEKGSKITELMYILAFSPTFYAIILSFGSNYLLIQNEDILYKKIIIYVSLFGTVLSLILVPSFHLFGGALTIILTQLLLALALIQSIFFLKNKKTKIFNKEYHAKTNK